MRAFCSRSREVGAGLLALVGSLEHRRGDDLLEILRHVLALRVDGRRRGIDDLVQQLDQIAGAEGPDAGQQLVHHGAQRIEVRVVRQLQALHLFGRHVRRGTGDAFDARDLRVGDQRDAEVDDAHVGILREHDVRRLDVAMDDATRMGVVQRLGALEHDLDHVVDAQQVVRAAIRRQGARAVHVLGDDVAAAVFFAGVVDGQDVRVLQHADHVRFRQEHLAGDLGPFVALIRVHVVDLDRDITAVIGVVR
jgi:hypothetical protein